MGKHERLIETDRTAQRRGGLRARGLRPRTIWIPDLRAPAMRQEVGEACRAIAASAGYDQDIAFIESLQEWPVDEAD